MTGAEIALPVEDAAEVERRFAAIQGELTPQTVLGAYFAHHTLPGNFLHGKSQDRKSKSQ